MIVELSCVSNMLSVGLLTFNLGKLHASWLL
jgi:hypothetical protein